MSSCPGGGGEKTAACGKGHAPCATDGSEGSYIILVIAIKIGRKVGIAANRPGEPGGGGEKTAACGEGYLPLVANGGKNQAVC